MQFFESSFSRLRGINIVTRSLWGILLTVFFIVILGIHTATAATKGTLVVRDDAGGSVLRRAGIIQTFRENGTRVELRGDYCMSACTMYLGLEGTCVAPGTVFGFHGPSSRAYGIALSSASFERWSVIMANHYPEPLRSWYLKNGRNRTVGFFRFSGSDLIEWGISQCED